MPARQVQHAIFQGPVKSTFKTYVGRCLFRGLSQRDVKKDVSGRKMKNANVRGSVASRSRTLLGRYRLERLSQREMKRKPSIRKVQHAIFQGPVNSRLKALLGRQLPGRLSQRDLRKGVPTRQVQNAICQGPVKTRFETDVGRYVLWGAKAKGCEKGAIGPKGPKCKFSRASKKHMQKPSRPISAPKGFCPGPERNYSNCSAPLCSTCRHPLLNPRPVSEKNGFVVRIRICQVVCVR